MKDKIKLSGKMVVIPTEEESTAILGFYPHEQGYAKEIKEGVEEILDDLSVWVDTYPNTGSKLKRVCRLLDQAYDLLDGK